MKVNTIFMALIAMTGLFMSCGDRNRPDAKTDSSVQSLELNNLAPMTVSETEKEFNTEEYNHITENRFINTLQQPVSTFSIDVDRAAYSNVRRFLNEGALPPPDAVRIEEMINYFTYNYPQPKGNDPFSITTELSGCPWNSRHQLVQVGLQGKTIPRENLPPANFVFLIDVSGSMNASNKLPLVQSSLNLLTDQLREKDKVAIVVYAGSAGLVLPSTSGDNKTRIKDAINGLQAGGSTAGGQGIELAYKIAKENFISGGNNRVVLATDGDFNVGASSEGDLVNLIEEKRKTGIFLTVLGFGMGNYKDNKMQQLADKGNGNHAYIDDISEANKVLVNEFGGSMYVIAKDVKLQIEFNPKYVQAYRLIGYENRVMANEDFHDDKKDAGEMGSGHSVTALYELIPVGVESEFIGKTDELKYQTKSTTTNTFGNELMTLKARYKSPDKEESQLITHPVVNNPVAILQASSDFRFATAVAEFGLLLRKSEYQKTASYNDAIELAKNALADDENGYRKECIDLMNKAAKMARN